MREYLTCCQPAHRPVSPQHTFHTKGEESRTSIGKENGKEPSTSTQTRMQPGKIPRASRKHFQLLLISGDMFLHTVIPPYPYQATFSHPIQLPWEFNVWLIPRRHKKQAGTLPTSRKFSLIPTDFTSPKIHTVFLEICGEEEGTLHRRDRALLSDNHRGRRVAPRILLHWRSGLLPGKLATCIFPRQTWLNNVIQKA